MDERNPPSDSNAARPTPQSAKARRLISIKVTPWKPSSFHKVRDGRCSLKMDAISPAVRDLKIATTFDVYLWDRAANQLRLLTAASNGDSMGSRISGDEQFIASKRVASTLVNDDHNGAEDVFVFDRTNGSIRNLTSVAASYSREIAINQDGSVGVFTTAARNLDGEDENGFFEYYAYSSSSLAGPVEPEPPVCGAATGAGIWESPTGARMEVI